MDVRHVQEFRIIIMWVCVKNHTSILKSNMIKLDNINNFNYPVSYSLHMNQVQLPHIDQHQIQLPHYCKRLLLVFCHLCLQAFGNLKLFYRLINITMLIIIIYYTKKTIKILFVSKMKIRVVSLSLIPHLHCTILSFYLLSSCFFIYLQNAFYEKIEWN